MLFIHSPNAPFRPSATTHLLSVSMNSTSFGHFSTMAPYNTQSVVTSFFQFTTYFPVYPCGVSRYFILSPDTPLRELLQRPTMWLSWLRTAAASSAWLWETILLPTFTDFWVDPCFISLRVGTQEYSCWVHRETANFLKELPNYFPKYNGFNTTCIYFPSLSD